MIETSELLETRKEVLELYSGMMVIDGLQLHRWNREIFTLLRDGGITAINATCSIWEDARKTLSALGEWAQHFREFSDLIMKIERPSDLEVAKAEGKVGIILGFQNMSAVEDELNLIEVFRDLGVMIMQLTYNNQNMIGGSCYEASDSGLARFGQEVIVEMNKVGVLVDLSHVGERTSRDAIELSSVPVAITHANVRELAGDVELAPRNKSAELVKALAARGGVIGLAVYPRLVPPGFTLSQFADMVARTADLIGVDHVGIGSDFYLTLTAEDIHYTRAGRWTRSVGPVTLPVWPDWCRTPADYPNIVGALLDRGMNQTEVRAVMGGNWQRLLGEVCG